MRAIQRFFFALFLALALSACADQVIHESDSPYGKLFVTESPAGVRTLLFDLNGGRQSVGVVSDPERLELAYAKSALIGLALVPKPQRVLVVGLGGGTLPRYFRLHYPQAQIDIAEINPRVVEVAERYFGFAQDARMKAHVGDGRAFVEGASPGSYDVVLLDAYSGNNVPAHLTTREFLRSVQGVLAPDGVVIANVWNRTANRVYDDMVQTYRDVFPEVQALQVPTAVNVILLATPRRLGLERDTLAAMARKSAAENGLRYDLGALVEQGYLPMSSARAGRVLRDPPQ